MTMVNAALAIYDFFFLFQAEKGDTATTALPLPRSLLSTICSG
jgi:hypothetical protein